MTAPTPATGGWEIRSWYLYYVGSNGLALFNFGPTAMQNLLQQAANAESGSLAFAGRRRDVNSIVLLANGMSFALQAVLFLVIGAYADFGTCRSNVLLFWSVVAYATGFAWLAVHEPARWRVGVGLYIVGLVAYQMTLTYWTAAFPSLARNTAHIRESRLEFESGAIAMSELDRRDEKERSRLSNVAFWAQSIGEVVMLAAAVAIMFSLAVDDSTANNNWGLSVLIAFATACWLLLSMSWFALEKKRPGREIPQGQSLATVGFWQLREAATQIWQLKQSLIYLTGYFLLSDSLNTSVTVIATLQNEMVSYNTLTLTYLLLVGLVAQAVGIGTFWLVQQRLGLGAKTMFNAVMAAIVIIDAWGMVGNWTRRFGFHNVWEIWLYQAFYGLLVCPWYSYSQIIISSVTPKGHEFLFFSLFNIVGKSSSFIGPIVGSAMVDLSPGGSNKSAPFYFLFALSLISAVGIWIFLDLESSAREQDLFLYREHSHAAGAGDDGKSAVAVAKE
ncbi:Autophagy-related protein 22 [Drechmeria coniospora]|uniref:Autophagy-related protein n=1 Tax=Drechmeria coniospora TaxID=98403 RepID=A0A151GM02_DRECN|nr:Autophagy-related protein 22 [Drechmeria coniospora]KYK58126.1 Autophagy-related protein 22 [Drechmeria coniospora]